MALKFNFSYSPSERSALVVYPELLSKYYPHIGKEGVILWLFMAFKAMRRESLEVEELASEANLSATDFEEAFTKLLQWELVSVIAAENGSQNLVVHDPSPAGEPKIELEDNLDSQESWEEVAATKEKAAESNGTDPFSDLLQYYESKVGWITSKICQDLAKWVDDGLEPAVIKEAVDEMMRRADSPRYPYLNAILLAWHQNGWLTMEDLEQARQKKSSLEGVPNAAAYKEVTSSDLERIRRWKELFPDEYDA